MPARQSISRPIDQASGCVVFLSTFRMLPSPLAAPEPRHRCFHDERFRRDVDIVIKSQVVFASRATTVVEFRWDLF